VDPSKLKVSKLRVLCDGNRLSGEVVVPPDPRGVVLLLHGLPSAQHPAHPDDLGYSGVAHTFADHGYAAAWFDMRGKDGKGFFSLEGWVRDARAALDSARTGDGLASLPLALVGASAGGAIAVQAARRGAPVKAIVLWAAPAEWVSISKDPRESVRRISEMTGMPIAPDVIEDPSGWHAEFPMNSVEKAVTVVRVPILVVHSLDDDIVPVAHADRIVAAAPNAECRLLEGQGHQLRRSSEAIQTSLDWLGRRLR